ncbi:Crp/Fnr family transcriptional regulator [Mesorhizobium sp. CA12]|uniref:Crp/Fnr family transcriptional regulator n=1 Tax=Mesorhizobium sp. CA12 TaxID=2876644 RepID=UPI001CCFB53E|nr:Crp/Fnr family transcriptional regulator [Mesorhizobium sp. CA12]MBZ9863683.1 Crp/Fnr family transcriptional regulator [Mesorhizobium sp. CA12]
MENPRKRSDPIGNNLLRALRADDWEILQPRLEQWSAPAGTLLHEPGDAVRYAYFPCGSALVSYRVVLSDGRAIETALIGREGAVGGIVSQGRLPAYARAEVQLGDSFFRIDLQHLEEAKLRSLTLRHLFARYADCLMAQVFQSVACSAAHSIKQRAARWLLAVTERTGAENLAVTQEQLATMLGVGRSYLSRVIRDLRQRGVIETRRSRLAVRSPEGLRSLACECNAAVSHHFNDVLKGVYPAEENGMTGALGMPHRKGQ